VLGDYDLPPIQLAGWQIASWFVKLKISPASRQTPTNSRSAKGLHDPKQAQYDDDHGDNDQKMDPTAGAR
jgi:hypothetical protein